MGRARESAPVSLAPAEALEAWTDLDRWPAFVDGLARVVSAESAWPAPGSEVVWESVPAGRGRVSERVESFDPPAGAVPGTLVTRVSDATLAGRQTATFRPRDTGTLVELELDYEPRGGGPLRGLTDLIFIRRAVSQSLARTVERFAARD